MFFTLVIIYIILLLLSDNLDVQSTKKLKSLLSFLINEAQFYIFSLYFKKLLFLDIIEPNIFKVFTLNLL
jgi:hypothetical protein